MHFKIFVESYRKASSWEKCFNATWRLVRGSLDALQRNLLHMHWLTKQWRLNEGLNIHFC